jgi:hypothetical protein
MWRRQAPRPPPTYEDVRLVSEVLSRINAGLIERHFAVSADIAQQFMERLVHERAFGEQQADGWHYPPIRKLPLRRTRRKPRLTNDFDVDEDIADRTASAEELHRRIIDLEQEGHALRSQVKRLQDAGKTVIRQREQWKARAVAAEEQMATERGRRSRRDERFDALRRLVAKELHPDFCNGGDIEKMLRAECFKRLWPEIERLAGRRPE